MDNLEKLISNLSNYWDLSPEKVVDRLNHMNESEIKNVVNKMTKKFKNGGMIDCLRKGGSIKDCGCGGKTPVAKAATGRVLGSEQYPHAKRKHAIEAGMNMGMDRATAVRAYQSQKAALKRQGYSGNEMRQHARWNLMDQAYPEAVGIDTQRAELAVPTPTLSAVKGLHTLSDDIHIEDEPIVINDNPFGNLDSSVPTVGLMGDFNTAFGQARKRGLSSFSWDDPRAKYERYGTNLKKPSTGTAVGMTATPIYIPEPVDDGKGGKKYTYRDLLRMAAVNGAVNMK